MRGGIVMLLVALGMLAWFEQVDAPRYLRAVLFVPFFVAEYSFFQAIYNNCGMASLRGLRATPEGIEKIADPMAREACRCAGKTQIVTSALSAALFTMLFVLIG